MISEETGIKILAMLRGIDVSLAVMAEDTIESEEVYEKFNAKRRQIFTEIQIEELVRAKAVDNATESRTSMDFMPDPTTPIR